MECGVVELRTQEELSLTAVLADMSFEATGMDEIRIS